MEITNDLINRFFRKECTPEEADFVAAFLHTHPNYLDEHFSQQEFEATMPDETEGYAEDWQAWEQLQTRIKKQHSFKTFQRLAVAASVAVFCFLGFRYLYQPQEAGTATPTEYAANTQPADGWKEIANPSDTVMIVSLADGSSVRLSAGSNIRFNDSAWRTRRDLQLQGEATFEVAKDKTRPFTVYCGQVSTMALGTIFSVRQDAAGDSLRVRLYEGKVKVRKQQLGPNGDSADLVKPNILTPGQEILFAPGKDQAFVRSFMPNALPKYIARNKTADETNSLPSNAWIEFDNQPLSDLFVSLEVVYNVQINYNRRDIQNLSFIGRFEPYDNIDDILNIVARLNGLKVQKTGPHKYYLKKATR
jgi:transmembrane sensor